MYVIIISKPVLKLPAILKCNKCKLYAWRLSFGRWKCGCGSIAITDLFSHSLLGSVLQGFLIWAYRRNNIGNPVSILILAAPQEDLKPNECLACDFNYTDRVIYKRHLKTVHGLSFNNFKCFHCCQTFQALFSLERHMLKMHTDAPKAGGHSKDFAGRFLYASAPL